MNLTEKCIQQLQASAERQSFRDDEMTGFGIRIEPTASGGRKSFFWNAKVGGQVVFKSLGEFPSVSVKDARDAAKVWSGRASKWKQDGCPEDTNPFAKPKRQERTSVPLFGELLESYIKNHLLNPDPEIGALNKPRAEYDVRLLVKNYLQKLVDVPIDKITVNDVLAAKNSCEGLYMQNSIVELVRRLYNWSSGSKDGRANFWKVGKNPAADVSMNTKKKRKRYVNEVEMVPFEDELKKKTTPRDLRDFLILARSAAARKSNICAMRWSDISFERRDWHVPMSKSGHDYHVFLLDDAMGVLERRRREGTKQRIREDGDGSPFVFPSARSKSGHIIDVKKQWAKFRKACGLPDVRLHDMRRTAGSWMAIRGASQKQIADALGHRSLQSTEIYTELSQQAVREAREEGQQKMRELTAQARKRLAREARAPKLRVVNG
jgi:integrase